MQRRPWLEGGGRYSPDFAPPFIYIQRRPRSPAQGSRHRVMRVRFSKTATPPPRDARRHAVDYGDAHRRRGRGRCVAVGVAGRHTASPCLPRDALRLHTICRCVPRGYRHAAYCRQSQPELACLASQYFSIFALSGNFSHKARTVFNGCCG